MVEESWRQGNGQHELLFVPVLINRLLAALDESMASNY